MLGAILGNIIGIPEPIQERGVRHVHEELLQVLRRHPLPHYVEF